MYSRTIRILGVRSWESIPESRAWTRRKVCSGSISPPSQTLRSQSMFLPPLFRSKQITNPNQLHLTFKIKKNISTVAMGTMRIVPSSRPRNSFHKIAWSLIPFPFSARRRDHMPATILSLDFSNAVEILEILGGA